MCAELFGIIFAGHDSTSHSISWTIIEVCKRPDVLKKIQAEIDAVNPDKNNPFTPDHFPQLVYLDYVIKEAMRVWPAVPLSSAKFIYSDFPHENYILPKNSLVLLPTYALGRVGVQVFVYFVLSYDRVCHIAYHLQDPDVFRPERWCPDSPDIEVLNKGFMPFSVGKRNCVGMNLALTEMKLVLSTLYRTFEFELASDVNWKFSLTLKPINVFLRAHLRKSHI